MSTIPSTAKAWRYPSDHTTWKGYQSLELRDVPVVSPGKGEVLVKIRAVSFNYRQVALHSYWYRALTLRSELRDIAISKGLYPGGAPTDGGDGQGLIPTSDAAGDIVAIGEGVTGWAIGDRVHSVFFEGWVRGPLQPEYMARALGHGVQGCLSQYRIFSTDWILPIPTHLSYEEAATIPCAAVTAWSALFEKRNINEHSTVLVLGSGGVSVVAAQLAKAAGARVIATTSSQEKASKYRALGVDDVVNYRETPEWSEKVKELTGGQGVDDVIEIGGQGTLLQSIKSIKQEGFVHLIGFLAQSDTKETVSDVAVTLMFKQGSLNGISVGHKEAAQRVDAFLLKHKIKPVIDSKVFAWDEAVEAHAYMEGGLHFGKVVIKVD